MTRSEIKFFLGKNVEVTLYDDEKVQGTLRKTGEEAFINNPNLYIPKNYYFVTKNMQSNNRESCLFKVSHIKRIIELN